VGGLEWFPQLLNTTEQKKAGRYFSHGMKYRPWKSQSFNWRKGHVHHVKKLRTGSRVQAERAFFEDGKIFQFKEGKDMYVDQRKRGGGKTESRLVQGKLHAFSTHRRLGLITTSIASPEAVQNQGVV